MNNSLTAQHGAAGSSVRDPRIARTRAAVQQSVLALLSAGRDFGSLTVSEVAGNSGVTRKTFYSRFGTLEQLIDEILAETLSSIADQIDNSMLRFPLKDSSLDKLVFDAYKTHQNLLAPLIQHCPVSLFVQPFRRILSRLLSRAIEVNGLLPIQESKREYLVAIMASMTHTVLALWIERGFVDPPEQLAEMAHTLFGSGLQQLLSDNRA